ncbi:hypothetical protein [Pseudomonas fluorescens group sp. PF-69]
MANAHCICPSFLSSNISDPTVYMNVFLTKFLMSDDQIVLDREGKIVLAYVSALKDDIDGFKNYTAWKALVESKSSGKTLIASSGGANADSEVIYNTISNATTTFDKSIVAENNNHYDDFIDEINRQRINLLSLQSLEHHKISKIFERICGYADFEADLGWVIHRLGRLSKKNKLEDDYNDFLREMLLSKSYEVKDQTREGKSASKKGAGELDIVVENNGDLYTIIEAMKLSSVDKEYIDDHYKKLLTNYNPLAVKRTFLVTYYSGSKFSEWWTRYISHLNSLVMSSYIPGSPLVSVSIDEVKTPYGNLKKLHHHMELNGENTLCTHFAIKLDD